MEWCDLFPQCVTENRMNSLREKAVITWIPLGMFSAGHSSALSQGHRPSKVNALCWAPVRRRLAFYSEGLVRRVKRENTHFCLWLSLLEIWNIHLEGSDPAKVTRLDSLISTGMFLARQQAHDTENDGTLHFVLTMSFLRLRRKEGCKIFISEAEEWSHLSHHLNYTGHSLRVDFQC